MRISSGGPPARSEAAGRDKKCAPQAAACGTRREGKLFTKSLSEKEWNVKCQRSSATQ